MKKNRKVSVFRRGKGWGFMVREDGKIVKSGSADTKAAAERKAGKRKAPARKKKRKATRRGGKKRSKKSEKARRREVAEAIERGKRAADEAMRGAKARPKKKRRRTVGVSRGGKRMEVTGTEENRKKLREFLRRDS